MKLASKEEVEILSKKNRKIEKKVEILEKKKKKKN